MQQANLQADKRRYEGNFLLVFSTSSSGVNTLSCGIFKGFRKIVYHPTFISSNDNFLAQGSCQVAF
jgi:hypothetical protein